MKLYAYDINHKRIAINVMLHEGSDMTLIREGLVKIQGLKGKEQALSIEGVSGSRSHYASQRVQLQLQALDGTDITLQVSTLPTVTKPLPVTNWGKFRNRWEPLADISLQATGGRVEVLLGLDHTHILAVDETHKGKDFEPFASRTRLCWVVRGVTGADIHVEKVLHSVCTNEDNEILATSMRCLCKTDSFRTEH